MEYVVFLISILGWRVESAFKTVPHTGFDDGNGGRSMFVIECLWPNLTFQLFWGTDVLINMPKIMTLFNLSKA